MCWLSLCNWVGTVSTAATLLAKVSQIEGIDPLDERFEVLRLVGDKSGLEVSAQGTFRADSCSGEICRADKGFLSIDDDRLGVDAWAEDTLEKIGLNESRVSVKVLAETWSGFLRVEETD